MKQSEASITTILGMRGCGKSTLTRRLAEQHSKKIVFDIVQEWNDGTHYCSTYEEFANIWREIFNRDQYTVVVQFDYGTETDSMIDVQTRITQLIFLSGKDSQIETCIIFEEAHFYFPTHGLDAKNMHFFTVGRHGFVNVIANTQRPASLSKLLISQSKELYIGSLYEMNDIKYLADCVGELAYEARNIKPFEFIYYPVGNRDNISIIEL